MVTMPKFLYYIKAGDDVNNEDLFVCAVDCQQALGYWQSYYTHTEGEYPESIRRVCATCATTSLGSFPWPSIPQFKFRTETTMYQVID